MPHNAGSSGERPTHSVALETICPVDRFEEEAGEAAVMSMVMMATRINDDSDDVGAGAW